MIEIAFCIIYRLLRPTPTSIRMPAAAESDEDCVIKNPGNILETFTHMFGFKCIPHPPISDKLYDGFLLPIDYLDKSQRGTVPKSVAEDLELVRPITESSPSMYDFFCEPSNDFGKMLIPEMAKQYTTNTGFLKDTQTVIDRVIPGSTGIDSASVAKFQEIWKEIKEDAGFLESHSYMEFVFLEELNKSRGFLSAYSALNLVSPIYSLVMPLVILLMPFILLKIWRVPINFSVYLSTLRDVSKQHFIGRILNIRELNFENVVYILFIGGMYIMQTYSQVVSCIKYHQAIKKMNGNLWFLRDYLDGSIESMSQFIRSNSDLPYYSDFCQDVHSHKLVLIEIRDKIGDKLTPYGWTIKKIGELGHMFDCYYQLYSCMDYEASLRYSVGFEGYMDLLRGVAFGLNSGLIGKASFSEENLAIFSDQYYPAHKNTGAKTNTVDLSTNIIITGVNASGKTTALKTTALNILFSQQFGCGFYSSCVINPFQHIHSYLNIPDTSGRDSLFQAESRRCKEILDRIRDVPVEERHFCIFDELYSGTNPKEAAKSAHSLLKYLSEKGNVRFALTTHYVNVCRKFKKSDVVKNYKMVVNQNADGGFEYTYKMRPGISTLEGGLAILKTMDYPSEIINTIERR